MNTIIGKVPPHAHWLKAFCFGVALVIFALAFTRRAQAEQIRDITHMKNEVPNELVGMGLVTGLRGTGDGGDFLPTMRPLKEVMQRFDDAGVLEKELKNANDVAIVMLSMALPPHGAHAGDTFDVKVSAIAAKSLRGGRLFIVPLFAPRADVKVVLASASGELLLDDESHPTEATIQKGGVMIEDVLADSIQGNQFTLVLDQQAASHEKAAAIADQINEEILTETSGKAIAVALDASSVVVKIPPAEQANPTPFIAWVQGRNLPVLPEPATVWINTKDNSIVFTETVELAPTLISYNNLTITVGDGGQNAPPAGSRQPFVAINSVPAGDGGNARMRDLQNAFNLLKVSAADRVHIVMDLHKSNVLKAKLIVN